MGKGLRSTMAANDGGRCMFHLERTYSCRKAGSDDGSTGRAIFTPGRCLAGQIAHAKRGFAPQSRTGAQRWRARAQGLRKEVSRSIRSRSRKSWALSPCDK